MTEFLKSLESSSWQLQREAGEGEEGGFYLTMALTIGSLLWSGCLTFPTLLAPSLPLSPAACVPSAGALGATLSSPQPSGKEGSSSQALSSTCGLCPITIWQGPRARAPCLSSESPSLCARQELQGEGVIPPSEGLEGVTALSWPGKNRERGNFYIRSWLSSKLVVISSQINNSPNRGSLYVRRQKPQVRQGWIWLH